MTEFPFFKMADFGKLLKAEQSELDIFYLFTNTPNSKTFSSCGIVEKQIMYLQRTILLSTTSGNSHSDVAKLSVK